MSLLVVSLTLLMSALVPLPASAWNIPVASAPEVAWGAVSESGTLCPGGQGRTDGAEGVGLGEAKGDGLVVGGEAQPAALRSHHRTGCRLDLGATTRTRAAEGRPAFAAESCLVAVLGPTLGTLHARDLPWATQAGSLRRRSVLRLAGGSWRVKDARAAAGRDAWTRSRRVAD